MRKLISALAAALLISTAGIASAAGVNAAGNAAGGASVETPDASATTGAGARARTGTGATGSAAGVPAPADTSTSGIGYDGSQDSAIGNDVRDETRSTVRTVPPNNPRTR